jgi:hypothetical protein
MERATGFETVNAVSRSFAKIRIRTPFSLGFSPVLTSRIDPAESRIREPKGQKYVTNRH